MSIGKARRFVPTPEEVQQYGAVPMTKEEIVEVLAKYKSQNPTKYEAKKAAILARYGLLETEEKEEEVDEELETAKKVAKKAAKK